MSAPGRLLASTLALLSLVVGALHPGASTAGGDASRDEEPRPPVEEIVVKGVRLRGFRTPPSVHGTLVETADYVGEDKSIEDLLAQQSGVQIRRYGGPGEASEISIRGSASSQVAVLFDGVPLDSPLTGSVDLSQICLGAVGEIELSRGAGGSELGSGAMGGVVRLRSPRPGARTVHRANVSGGAFGTWQGALHRSGHAGPIDYAAGYCGFKTDGDYEFARPHFQSPVRISQFSPEVIERPNNRHERHSGRLEIGRAWDAAGRLTLRNYVTYASHGEPGLDATNGPTAGQNLEAHTRSLHDVLSLRWEGPELPVFDALPEVAVYHRYQRAHYRSPPTVEDGEGVDTLTQISTVGGIASTRFQQEALGGLHRLKLRLDTRTDILRSDWRRQVTRTGIGVALQYESSWLDRRLILVPALRFDATEGHGEHWLPSAGIVLAPWPWLRLRSHVERAFRAPGFEALYYPNKGYRAGNPDLLPERSLHADVGLDFVLSEAGWLRDLELSFGLFRMEIDDTIVWMLVSPSRVEPRNTGAARVDGFELGLRFGLTDYLRVAFTHSRLDATSTRMGLPLAGRAESTSNVRLELGPPRVWKLVAELQHTGEIPTRENGSSILPARAVWNTSASLNLAAWPLLRVDRYLRELWIFARLANVSDVAVRDGLYTPQPGRHGSVGLELEF